MQDAKESKNTKSLSQTADEMARKAAYVAEDFAESVKPVAPGQGQGDESIEAQAANEAEQDVQKAADTVQELVQKGISKTKKPGILDGNDFSSWQKEQPHTPVKKEKGQSEPEKPEPKQEHDKESTSRQLDGKLKNEAPEREKSTGVAELTEEPVPTETNDETPFSIAKGKEVETESILADQKPLPREDLFGNRETSLKVRPENEDFNRWTVENTVRQARMDFLPDSDKVSDRSVKQLESSLQEAPYSLDVKERSAIKDSNENRASFDRQDETVESTFRATGRNREEIQKTLLDNDREKPQSLSSFRDDLLRSKTRKSQEDGLRVRANAPAVKVRTGELSDVESTFKAIGQEEKLIRATEGAAKAAQQGGREAAKAAGKTAARGAGAAAGGAATGGVSLAAEAVKKAAVNTGRTIRKFAEGSTENDHSNITGLLTGAGGLIAGGGCLFAALFLPVLFLMVIVVAISGLSSGNQNLSDDVLALMPKITAACEANGMTDYIPLVAAICMQESGGNAELVDGDVMQCAEGMGLPVGTPVDVDESINFGVQLLKGLIQRSGATGPTDLDRLKVAIQAYNFGGGYIDWTQATNQGKYTKENAIQFAQRQADRLGWSSYGDVDYVDHVLRYYNVGGGFAIGDASLLYPMLSYPMPGYQWITYVGHEGIDVQCGIGTPVYACAAGTVTYTKDNWTNTDGVSGMMSYGNCVCISHGDGLETRYGHLSAVVVQSGALVLPGQLIGYSGNTGNSSGPHMHLAIYDNGSPGQGGWRNNAARAFPNEKQ